MVVDYRYTDNDISARVLINNDTRGYTADHCPSGKLECYENFMKKRPIGDEYHCWYDQLEKEAYRVYNRDPLIELRIMMGCLFGFSLGCFLIYIFRKYYPRCQGDRYQII